jgi:hypothetical protein
VKLAVRDMRVCRAVKPFISSEIWISPAQKQAFAGNAITLSDQRVWMSACAAASLTDTQREALADHGFAVGAVELDEIEKAGGSLRCCVGEIY